MRCPQCACAQTEIVDWGHKLSGQGRYERCCLQCGHVWRAKPGRPWPQRKLVRCERCGGLEFADREHVCVALETDPSIQRARLQKLIARLGL